jgi:hypothetical protein
LQYVQAPVDPGSRPMWICHLLDMRVLVSRRDAMVRADAEEGIGRQVGTIERNGELLSVQRIQTVQFAATSSFGVRTSMLGTRV